MSIANIGIGWPSVLPAIGITIPDCLISGAGDGLYEFDLTVTNNLSDGKMAPSLAVYETQPLKSKLDIYWETSTNGLIDELNAAIIEGDTTTPEGFMGYTQPVIIWDHNENMDIGTDITPTAIIPRAPDGSAINGPNYATLLSVIDGTTPTGVDRTGEFTIVNHSNQSFSIETNSYFMCDVDNNTKGEFTFNINIQVPGPTFPIDGVYISRDLPLGPYTLENIPPAFTTTMLDGFIADDPSPTSAWADYFVLPNWSTVSPPYTSGYFKHTNKVFDHNNAYNTTTGLYTCVQTGIYDVSLNTTIHGEWQVWSGSWYYSPGLQACSNILGQLYIKKSGGANLAQEQIALSYHDRIHTNGYHRGTTGVRWNTYGNIQGYTKGWSWVSGIARPDGANYKLSINNLSLVAGEQLEIGIIGAMMGNADYGKLAYGKAFFNTSENFYEQNGSARIVVPASIFSVTASSLTATTGASLIHVFSAINGSYDTPANGLKTEGLTFALDNDYNGLFYLNNLSNGDVEFSKNSGGTVGKAYDLKIIATDASGNGLSTDLDFVVILT